MCSGGPLRGALPERYRGSCHVSVTGLRRVCDKPSAAAYPFAVFERFTESARQVVVAAQRDARELGHDYIGTEHLLLGLLRVEEGAGAKVLVSLGVAHERVRELVEQVVGHGDAERGPGQIPFSPRAKKVLELSLREALSLGHDYIGTEHILLGLLREPEGAAARVLLEFDLRADLVRARLVDLFGYWPEQRPRRGLAGRRRRAVVQSLPAAGPWEYRLERADSLDP